jgi:hypothetical protein
MSEACIIFLAIGQAGSKHNANYNNIWQGNKSQHQRLTIRSN